MLRRTALAATLSTLIACSGGACGAARAKPESARGKTLPTVVFRETCDGSAAVLLPGGQLLVGNDEDNLLRIYDARHGGRPLSQLDLGPALRASASRAGEQRTLKEADLEGAALLDDAVYWIGSHGRNASGKVPAERRTLLATALPVGGGPPAVLGTPYRRLLEVLASDARYAAFQLQQASERAPKEKDGLNIEALAARREGGLWIGFRSPNPQGKALLAALLNPRQVIDGAEAQLAEPLLLELGGLGTRDLARFRGGYLLLAGSHAEGGRSRLFSWDGKGQPRLLTQVDLSGLNPEGLAIDADAKQVLVLSDDGTRELAGDPCKDLADGAHKSFRGVWLSAQDSW